MRWSFRSGVVFPVLVLLAACGRSKSEPETLPVPGAIWFPGEWTIASAGVWEPGIDPPIYAVGDSITFALDRIEAERRGGVRQDLSRAAIEERLGFPLDEYENLGSACYVFLRFLADRRQAAEGVRWSYSLTIHCSDFNLPPIGEEECEIDWSDGNRLAWHALYGLRTATGR